MKSDNNHLTLLVLIRSYPVALGQELVKKLFLVVLFIYSVTLSLGSLIVIICIDKIVHYSIIIRKRKHTKMYCSIIKTIEMQKILILKNTVTKIHSLGPRHTRHFQTQYCDIAIKILR